jgi:hypothetical protein
MKTYTVKQGDYKRETQIVDAKDQILGRVATEIAKILMGKNKHLFARNADIGECYGNQCRKNPGNRQKSPAEAVLLAFQLSGRL